MRIETIHVGEMGTNCYLAWDAVTGRGLLVDPGEQAEKIIRVCSRYQVTPEAVLLTHGHFDHIMAAKRSGSSIRFQSMWVFTRKNCLQIHR